MLLFGITFHLYRGVSCTTICLYFYRSCRLRQLYKVAAELWLYIFSISRVMKQMNALKTIWIWNWLESHTVQHPVDSAAPLFTRTPIHEGLLKNLAGARAAMHLSLIMTFLSAPHFWILASHLWLVVPRESGFFSEYKLHLVLWSDNQFIKFSRDRTNGRSFDFWSACDSQRVAMPAAIFSRLEDIKMIVVNSENSPKKKNH